MDAHGKPMIRVSSASHLKGGTTQWMSPKALTPFASSGEDLHLRSWKGLTKAGVHVREQEVDVGRR